MSGAKTRITMRLADKAEAVGLPGPMTVRLATPHEQRIQFLDADLPPGGPAVVALV
jgi:hypothetical protein